MSGSQASLWSEVDRYVGQELIGEDDALGETGHLVTLEADARYAEVAGANIERAGLVERVEIRVGPALETLPRLAQEQPEPFDLVFIDADKIHTPDYYEWARRLTRPGSLIVADNVIRDGAIVEFEGDDPGGVGARRLHELLAADPRVSATTIQTVGLKGYDGVTLVLVGQAD